jgi:hypothetical protein
MLRESASILFSFRKLENSGLLGGFFGGSVLNPYFVDLVGSKFDSAFSFFGVAVSVISINFPNYHLEICFMACVAGFQKN